MDLGRVLWTKLFQGHCVDGLDQLIVKVIGGGVFGGIGGEDDDLGADEAGEGRGGLGDDAGNLDRFGEGGRLEGGVVEADELLAEDVDLGGEVDLGELFGAIFGRFGTRGETMLAGVEVAGLGTAFAFFGGGRRGHGAGNKG